MDAPTQLSALGVTLSPKAVRWLWVGLSVLLWLACGVAGDWTFSSAWRQSRAIEFRSAVEAIASLTSRGDWREPWETDPQWLELERQLNADLVPLPAAAPVTESRQMNRGAASASVNSVDAAKRRIGSDQDTSVQWIRTPRGQWRASVTVPIAGKFTAEQQPGDLPSSSAELAPPISRLHATRSFDDQRGRVVWWALWTFFCTVVFAATFLAQRRTRSDEPQFPPDALASPSNLTGVERVEPLEGDAEKMSRILGHLNEGLLAIDDQGRVLLLNAALRSQLNLGLEEFYLRPLVEVIRLPRVVEVLERVLATRQTSEQTIEVGSPPRFLRLIASPWPTHSGASGVLLTVIDVSSMQRSELARREFITGASHELKTPLAAIRAYTETLQAIGRDDPDATERFLANILTQADRMDRLVTGMLQLARAESGNLRLKSERIDAVATIEPCLLAALAMGQAKGIVLRTQVPSQQLLVLADRDALQTIASNLLSNAVRYTPPGGHIDVQLLRDGASVLLRVKDDGIGIAEADQTRIFERFYRVQKDRGLDSGGTGLGLAIVEKLIQALSGTVELTSRPGEGTCFEIRLPAVGFTQSSSKQSGLRAQVR